MTSIFSFLSFEELYIMGCMLLLLEYYGLAGVQGGGVTMTTGLLRGLGLLVERGRSVHAMSLVHACLVG